MYSWYFLCPKQVLRVYYDRLVNDEDQASFFGYLKQVADDKLPTKFNVLLERLTGDEDPTKMVTEEDIKNLLFCDFYDSKVNEYMEVLDLDILRKIVEARVDEYNSIMPTRMDLVTFR